MRRVVVGVMSVLLIAMPAYPCGGPGADIVDMPLVPVSRYLAHTLYDDEYEVRYRPELRFLDPFHRAAPDSVARLYEFAYEGGGVPDDVADTLPRHFEREMLAPAVRAVEQGA